MPEQYNTKSLDTLCAALCQIMGIAPPELAASPAEELVQYADTVFDGGKADRIFMYNPDAVAQWIEDKYPQYIKNVTAITDFTIQFKTVMPSVTPVCFATMYTGTQPEVHGIRKYEKPVLAIDTLFDDIIKSGKKAAIVADKNCSIGKIFLNRNMDYYIYDNLPEINAKAAELIMRDEHDLIVVYNGNYDSVMHKNGPEAPVALAELRQNDAAFATFCELIKNNWQAHNTLAGFAMDHGCHEIDGDCGSHGLDMPEDINIRHHYIAYKAI